MKRILGVLIAAGFGAAVLGVSQARSDFYGDPPCNGEIDRLEWREQVVKRNTGALKRQEDVIHYTLQVELDLKLLNIKLPELPSSTGGEDPQWLTDALRSIDESNLTEAEKESARQQLRDSQQSNITIEDEYFFDFDYIQIVCTIDKATDSGFRILGKNSRRYHPRFVNGVVTQVSVPICIPAHNDPRDATDWRCLLTFNGGYPSATNSDPELKAAPGTELVTSTGGPLIFGMDAQITFGFVAGDQAGDQQRTFEEIELPEESPIPLPVIQ